MGRSLTKGTLRGLNSSQMLCSCCHGRQMSWWVCGRLQIKVPRKNTLQHKLVSWGMWYMSPEEVFFFINLSTDRFCLIQIIIIWAVSNDAVHVLVWPAHCCSYWRYLLASHWFLTCIIEMIQAMKDKTMSIYGIFNHPYVSPDTFSGRLIIKWWWRDDFLIWSSFHMKSRCSPFSYYSTPRLRGSAVFTCCCVVDVSQKWLSGRLPRSNFILSSPRFKWIALYIQQLPTLPTFLDFFFLLIWIINLNLIRFIITWHFIY